MSKIRKRTYEKDKINVRIYITPIFFSLLVLIAAIHYIFSVVTAQDTISLTSRPAVVTFFNTNIFAHDSWIDVYGLEQRCMGKRQIERFKIYKTGYGKMVEVKEEYTAEEVEEKVNEIFPIIAHLNDKDVPYYYMTSIFPVQDISDLPYGVSDWSHTNQLLTGKVLAERNITIFEPDETESVKTVPKEKLFYRTDHHWTMETCFATYQGIINTMESDLGWKLNAGETTDKNNYSEYRIKDSFLGSYGVKVGKYYAGKDDFVIFIPKFSTEMLFQSYDADGELQLEKSGDFYQALLDREILEDPTYKNKYNAICNQACIENHIVNYSAPDSLKCLIISHSYGRPLAMYLSLNFSEVVNLDPQKGRYEGSYIDFIDTFEPDIVLLQVEIEGEIIGEFPEGD